MDLREDPAWRPLTATFTYGEWDVWLWTEPRLPGEDTADPHLIRPLRGRLRLAVADPAATCPTLTPTQVAWAGQLALSAAAVEPDLRTALDAGAARIHDPALRPRLANACAQVAVADLDLRSGHVEAARAGDCEVWVRRGETSAFELLLPGDRLTPQAQAAFAAHPGARSTAGAQAHYRAHVEVLDDPGAWVTAPLGLDVPARAQFAEADDVAEVIVASDGARLTAERCRSLRHWLAGELQMAPAGHPHPSPHGDVTVLHARRRHAAEQLVHCRTCGVRLERFPQFTDGAGGEWLTPVGEVCCEAPAPR